MKKKIFSWYFQFYCFVSYLIEHCKFCETFLSWQIVSPHPSSLHKNHLLIINNQSLIIIITIFLHHLSYFNSFPCCLHVIELILECGHTECRYTGQRCYTHSSMLQVFPSNAVKKEPVPQQGMRDMEGECCYYPTYQLFSFPTWIFLQCWSSKLHTHIYICVWVCVLKKID